MIQIAFHIVAVFAIVIVFTGGVIYAAKLFGQMMDWLYPYPRPSPIPHPAPIPSKTQLAAVRTITEAELDASFRAAPDAPLWAAVLAVIDLKILETMNRALDEKQPDGETKFHLGSAAGLQELKDDFLERERKAREPEEESEGGSLNAKC